MRVRSGNRTETLARRAAQQGALYRFTDRLHRAESLPEVYGAALDAILIALRCDRASILIFDDAGVMRFVGWRELSDDYRRAVEGHSPWRPGELDVKPICMRDVLTEDLDAHLKDVIATEGIRSLAFVPVQTTGKLLGKFMVYFDAPHAFTENELDLALTIGRQIAFGVERKRAEEALRRERELLRTIIDRIPVMITVYEPETEVLRLNPEFERVTGWANDTSAGQSLMEACYPDPELRQRVRRFMESSQDGWMDIRMSARDGNELETCWANIRLSDGTRVGIGIDITDRKKAEETLREADRRKDEFLATLAHELRNPLAPIRNAVQVQKTMADLEPQLAWTHGVIDRQVHHMSRLLEDLLDVSRISRNKLELRKERVELSSVMEVALETTRPLMEEAGHRLDVCLPADPVWLDADPVRLAQVFANLLNNAAKYTDPGGLIRLGAERVGDEVVVSIRDQGIGIASDMLPRIFEIFSQTKPALERTQGGLGIGLSLTKHVVEAHGGRIEARSEGTGKGSEFIVRLPVLGSVVGKETEHGVDAKPSGFAARRILILDDNQDSADSLCLLLRLSGHETHAVYEPFEAMKAASTLRPDVVLLDIGLPKISGYEVCRQIRAEPWGKSMVMVALTGWGQDEDRRKSREAGFDHHMTKPVDYRRLMNVLASRHAAGGVARQSA